MLEVWPAWGRHCCLEGIPDLMLEEPECNGGKTAQPELTDSPRISQDPCVLQVLWL